MLQERRQLTTHVKDIDVIQRDIRMQGRPNKTRFRARESHEARTFALQSYRDPKCRKKNVHIQKSTSVHSVNRSIFFSSFSVQPMDAVHQIIFTNSKPFFKILQQSHRTSTITIMARGSTHEKGLSLPDTVLAPAPPSNTGMRLKQVKEELRKIANVEQHASVQRASLLV